MKCNLTFSAKRCVTITSLGASVPLTSNIFSGTCLAPTLAAHPRPSIRFHTTAPEAESSPNMTPRRVAATMSLRIPKGSRKSWAETDVRLAGSSPGGITGAGDVGELYEPVAKRLRKVSA